MSVFVLPSNFISLVCALSLSTIYPQAILFVTLLKLHKEEDFVSKFLKMIHDHWKVYIVLSLQTLS